MINGIDYLKKMYPDRDEKDYQPSGLDLRVGKVFKIKDANCLCAEPKLYGIVDGEKYLPELIEVEPQTVNGHKDVFAIEWDDPYIFEVQEQIQIGDHNAQFYLPRSTLLRMGVNVYTALGDLGYNGHLQFLVINHGVQTFYISKGERFAQLVDFEVKGGSESYNGDYQEEVDWRIDATRMGNYDERRGS